MATTEFCKNCGVRHGGSVFCSECGQSQDPNAPLIGDPSPPIPPAPDRIQMPVQVSPPTFQQQNSSPGVWTGVKLGCGMFIVLPILIILILLIFGSIVSGVGGGM